MRERVNDEGIILREVPRASLIEERTPTLKLHSNASFPVGASGANGFPTPEARRT